MVHVVPNARRRWRLRRSPHAGALRDTDYPPLIQRLLENRGIADAAQASAFLDDAHPSFDPATLPDAATAVERLSRAAAANEAVAVFGDFDVDGITSVAILTEGLTALGARVIPYIPDRFAEGYGLNQPAIQRLHDEGASLLLAVDCGTSSVEEVAFARSLGMDVLIVDHHVASGDRLPDALALVNPKSLTARDWHFDLASAGLAYFLLRALFDALGRSFPEQRFLELAALGTVADMAPLLGANRWLAQSGLAAVQQTERCGLRALMEVASVHPSRIDTESLSFVLSPRLNAAGRLAHARLSLELLLCDDDASAWEMARQLDSLNRQRQRHTATALDLAWSLFAEEDDASLLMIGHSDVPAGVAGLVASKMAEALYRPVVVYQRGETESRASSRSIPEFDIASALRGCDDLFLRFGGHPQAAGFTADNACLPAIKERLTACAEEQLAGLDLAPVIDVDAEVGLRELGRQEIRWLAKLAPHGVDNREPVFLSRGVTAADCRVMGGDGKHLRLKLKDGYVTWPAVGFGLGSAAVPDGQRIDAVYSLSSDRRDGSLQLTLHDLRPSV
ncbi:MAG: single-stranded-DNA-specific exonuclease RecJ [Dehalococcoidia bacterium]